MKKFQSRFAAVQRLRKQEDAAAAAMAANAIAKAESARQAVLNAEEQLRQTFADAQSAMSKPVSALLLHVARNQSAVDISKLLDKRTEQAAADERQRLAAEQRVAAYQQLQIVSEALSRDFQQHRKTQQLLQSNQIMERFQQQSHTTKQQQSTALRQSGVAPRSSAATNVVAAETGANQ